TYYWFVTDTGGVDYLDGALTYNFQGKNRVESFHKQLLQYAYINYNENQIPRDFVTSIKNSIYYKGFNSRRLFFPAGPEKPLSRVLSPVCP
ncbi:hypothetical protein O5817_27760, partial [Escherichia coli]|nr:hypothetical protein [Escherichia coli]